MPLFRAPYREHQSYNKTLVLGRLFNFKTKLSNLQSSFVESAKFYSFILTIANNEILHQQYLIANNKILHQQYLIDKFLI